MPKVKLTPGTQEEVTFTHFHIKSITLSRQPVESAKFRIDVVGQRYALDGAAYIYENATTTFTNTDFVPLVKEVMIALDTGINASNVETKYSQAFAQADKGNTAEQFAGMLELAGKLLHHAGKIALEEVEE